jgi:hypothetical protein
MGQMQCGCDDIADSSRADCGRAIAFSLSEPVSWGDEGGPAYMEAVEAGGALKVIMEFL